MNRFSDFDAVRILSPHIAFVWPRCFFFLAVYAVFTASTFAQAAEQDSTTFIVVRHAERDGDLDQLTIDGEKRARMLATLGKALNVEDIYSTDTNRTKRTVQPLAAAIDTQIRIYGAPDSEWIESLREEHRGQVVLIVGHSNTAGVIAGLLAKREPYEIEHDEYDAIFLVRNAESTSDCVRLRFGRSSKGAPSAALDKMGELKATR